jgi:hypothetical protein
MQYYCRWSSYHGDCGVHTFPDSSVPKYVLSDRYAFMDWLKKRIKEKFNVFGNVIVNEIWDDNRDNYKWCGRSCHSAHELYMLWKKEFKNL